jgi:hypothetical protein
MLETSNDIGPAYHYQGRLSEDRQVITGSWDNGLGAGLRTPEKYRRIP